MATTCIIPMHIKKSKSFAQSLKEQLDYALNPDKTDSGNYVSSFACIPETASQEFLLSRSAYVMNTGRSIEGEITAYQVRQSFVAGEITPEEANKIGYMLAEQLTGGEYAFVVATHVNTDNIHNHVIINAVSMDCTKKYRNRIRSFEDVERISDQLCQEHGLSVVEEKKDKSITYDKWLGDKAKTSHRDTVRIILDAALRQQPDGFDALMQLLEDVGCLVKRGAHISIKPPNGTRFVRLDSLGSEYSEATLRATLSGEHVHIPRIPRGKYTAQQIGLLIDIEQKMNEGKSRGYQIWAERHNLDVVSKSMIYLKENHIDSYETLTEMIQTSTKIRNELKDRIKRTQNRMNEIREQKKAITTYRRTKDIYTQYRKSNWSQAFYNEHAKEIEAHKKAEAVYAKAGGTLPKLDELSAEFDQLLEQKRMDSAEHERVKVEVSSLWHIKTNLDIITDDVPHEYNQNQRTKQNTR